MTDTPERPDHLEAIRKLLHKIEEAAAAEAEQRQEQGVTALSAPASPASKAGTTAPATPATASSPSRELSGLSGAPTSRTRPLPAAITDGDQLSGLPSRILAPRETPLVPAGHERLPTRRPARAGALEITGGRRTAGGGHPGMWAVSLIAVGCAAGIAIATVTSVREATLAALPADLQPGFAAVSAQVRQALGLTPPPRAAGVAPSHLPPGATPESAPGSGTARPAAAAIAVAIETTTSPNVALAEPARPTVAAQSPPPADAAPQPEAKPEVTAAPASAASELPVVNLPPEPAQPPETSGPTAAERVTDAARAPPEPVPPLPRPASRPQPAVETPPGPAPLQQPPMPVTATVHMALAAVIEARSGETVPFPLLLAPVPVEHDGLLLVVRGLPGEASLNAGSSIAPEVWLMPADRAIDLTLSIAGDTERSLPLSIELATVDGHTLARAQTTLTLLAAPAVPPPAIPAQDLARLVERGDSLLAAGDVAAARLMFERAADGGSTLAAYRLGESYDTVLLLSLGVIGVNGNEADARRWYERAAAAGHPAAIARLKELGPR